MRLGVPPLSGGSNTAGNRAWLANGLMDRVSMRACMVMGGRHTVTCFEAGRKHACTCTQTGSQGGRQSRGFFPYQLHAPLTRPLAGDGGGGEDTTLVTWACFCFFACFCFLASTPFGLCDGGGEKQRVKYSRKARGEVTTDLPDATNNGCRGGIIEGGKRKQKCLMYTIHASMTPVFHKSARIPGRRKHFQGEHEVLAVKCTHPRPINGRESENAAEQTGDVRRCHRSLSRCSESIKLQSHGTLFPTPHVGVGKSE